MKKIIRIVCCLVLLLGLTACGQTKEVVKEKDFKDTLREQGFSITDVTNQMEDKTIKNVTVANNGKYQMEYYEFKDDKTAIEAYKNNMKTFKEKRKDYGKETKKDNYNNFTQELSDTYNSVTRVGNTLLYASINIEYKKEFKKVLKSLNY